MSLPYSFSFKLIEWSQKNDRQLPWKQTNDPYKIWLSEIILQQTRIDQGTPYYLKFVSRFPTIKDLADAKEDEVLKLWQGLGYYSRARNLHFTAKFITHELNGNFPSEYNEILKLKGVGVYTAAAISSFAFGLPQAVVDGNVYRVLSRIFGIDTPIDSTSGKKEFSALAQSLMDKAKPAQYNQAIMDFGALQCSPKSPDCLICPFNDICIAFNHKRITQLPVKSKKITIKNRYFHYLVVNHEESTFVRKRSDKDIWKGLYEFPLIECASLLSPEKLQNHAKWKSLFTGSNIEVAAVSRPFKQKLTHQHIHAIFLEIKLSKPQKDLNSQFKVVPKPLIQQFAFPKIITWFLSDKSLYLGLK